jgi:putative phosphoesterase
MKIGVLSDTHGFLPPPAFEFFKGCNQIWHAGDAGNMDVLTELETIAPVVAVWGNCDNWSMRSKYPEYQIFKCEKHKIALMHIVGKPGHYSETALKIIREEKPTVFVAGHSHILLIKYDEPNNLLFINPGAAGKMGIHHSLTMVRFEINGKNISNLDVYDLKRDNSMPL